MSAFIEKCLLDEIKKRVRQRAKKTLLGAIEQVFREYEQFGEYRDVVTTRATNWYEARIARLQAGEGAPPATVPVPTFVKQPDMFVISQEMRDDAARFAVEYPCPDD